MRILSFDTSHGAVSVCLMQSGTVVFEEMAEQNSSNRQDIATELMPAISNAIEKGGWNKSQIDLLVVGVGPGTFTAVRSAVVTARTLAQALNLPVIGISRTECLASYFEGIIAVILSVSDSSYFVSVYEFVGKESSTLLDPCHISSNELPAKLDKVEVCVIDEKLHKSLELQNYNCALVPVVKNMARVQAQIAWNRLSLKDPELSNGRKMLTDGYHWSKIEPLYLREPALTIKKQYADSNKTNDIN